MAKFKMFLVVLAACVVGGTILAGSASADSIGQCNNRPGNYVSSTSEWMKVLGNEGVISQATSTVFNPAGFASVDVTLGQWMKQRVMSGKAARPFSAAHDYGCRNGSMFDAGVRSYSRGKAIFYVLPRKYKKSDVSTHRTKRHRRAVTIRVRVIGLPDCGNPLPTFAYVKLYMSKPAPKKHKKVPVKSKPAPKTPAASTPACISNSSGNGAGSETAQCGSGNVNVCSVKGAGNTGNEVCSTNTNVDCSAINSPGSTVCSTTVIKPPPNNTPPPVVHSCTISVTNAKSDSQTAQVTVTGDAAILATTFSWGDGTSSSGVATGTHTYPTPPASGTPGDGVTYTINAIVTKFADGKTANCGTATFFSPAPPPNGNTNPPPPPPG